MVVSFVGLFHLLVPRALIAAYLPFNQDLSPTEMVKVNFRLGNKNWLVIFASISVSGIVVELGFVPCFEGVLLTAMLSKVPVY